MLSSTILPLLHRDGEMRKYLDMGAEEILTDIHNRWALKVGDSYLRITEAEYYPWDDVYTHRHPRQREIGTIYVHRSTNKEGSAYKNGSYKGMDITLNGGILIRGIRDKGVEVEGPCNVVDYICGKMKWTMEELERETRIIGCKWNNVDPIFGARVGLTLKRSDDIEEWGRSIILPYRSAIVIPHKEKKNFFVTDIDREDIPSTAISKWRKEYEEGKEMELSSTMSLLQLGGYFSNI